MAVKGCQACKLVLVILQEYRRSRLAPRRQPWAPALHIQGRLCGIFAHRGQKPQLTDGTIRNLVLIAVEHVATMVQLITEEHVPTNLNDQRYICPVGFPVSSKEKVVHASSGLELCAEVHPANSCWFCLCLQLHSRFFWPWTGKIFATAKLKVKWHWLEMCFLFGPN